MSVLLASVVAVAGLWYSADQTRHANEHARQERALTKEGQITDRYTAAVENLGADKLDTRLGGIYAFQRIMKDSPRDHPTICNVLNAYVRSHTAEKESYSVSDVSWPIKGQDVPANVRAALTVLAFRDSAHDRDFGLDMCGTRLDSVELVTSGPPHRAVLRGAELSGMTLIHANLTNADLSGANLHGSTLSGAELTGVEMTRINLTGADPSGTDLSDANLKDADLRGADLSGVKNLTREQASSAHTDGTTQLPAGLS
ncbi:pentapeptide repeat-containing protein [Streptomyces sp. NBC_00690]|uniref:pentapeptide repeat-containing protein n=1 Tax=Streptomyces sp. NBC_00690 TaxID=2975808 RepID=UPI002E2D7CCD|nr:pentapeptide repeat-containing protein [Streptomyces sp. NBC_00690]